MNAPLPAIIPFNELERMAQAIAKSGLFGVKDPTQALALMLTAQAEGLHPATVAQDYDIIKGKASRKTQSVLARFQAAGGTVKWEKLTDSEVIGIFTHPSGGSVMIDWSIERAKHTMVYEDGKMVPLAERQMYKNGYPRAMLRSRCISEGVRCVYPAAIGGLMTEVEAEDAEDPPEKDMGLVIVEQPEIQKPEPEKPSGTEGLRGAPTLEDCKALLNEQGKDAIQTLLDWKRHLLAADQVELDKLLEPIRKAMEKPVKPIQDGQKRIVLANIKRSQLTLKDLEEKFGKLDELKETEVNEVIEWLKSKPL